jgi:hypothetical protein
MLCPCAGKINFLNLAPHILTLVSSQRLLIAADCLLDFTALLVTAR